MKPKKSGTSKKGGLGFKDIKPRTLNSDELDKVRGGLRNTDGGPTTTQERKDRTGPHPVYGEYDYS